MQHKIKPPGLPGWLHHRVLCDYIRDAIKSGGVSYPELGLRDELSLLELELDCVMTAILQGHDSLVEQGLKVALLSKIDELHGVSPTLFQAENISQFLLPEDEPVAKAA